MPSLNYSVFADKVADGTKRQTIRAWRKRPFKVGDTLYHFTKQRTRKCRRLRKPDICTCAAEILITKYGDVLTLWNFRYQWLIRREREELAWDDGFESFAELLDFLCKKHGLPFKGQVIRW